MWLYEPDEVPKRKHHWKEPRAGFVMVGNVLIGKCPSTMTLESAEELLNSGVEWSPKGWQREYPQRIYAVSDGVLYRATPTNPGRSYHGFPEHYSRFPRGIDRCAIKLLDWRGSAIASPSCEGGCNGS
jgi:hypothetical protein